ncbi:hypothetical protein PT974_00315 [Cladobotryum mycophilum]|uniref:Uncharacterized protein n=1 Tax=Cladobotryum mycophilum TaxID=491253 RepID=A0ABR0T0K0_9HYPO
MSSWVKADIIALVTLLVNIVLAPVVWLIKAWRKNRIPKQSVEMAYELEVESPQ